MVQSQRESASRIGNKLRRFLGTWKNTDGDQDLQFRVQFGFV
jgi:hypothetical protein